MVSYETFGCYIAPDDDRTIERVVTALGDQPRGTALVVAGDFNTDLGEMESDGRGTEIVAALTEAGFEDMDDTRTIERVVTALGDQPRGTALVVAGVFNTGLGETESKGRGTKIAAALTEAGVEDMAAHFLPRKRRWGRERRAWSMVREGKVIGSQTATFLKRLRSVPRR